MPCAVAVRTAKAVTLEVPEAASSSLGNLARIQEKNSERDVHRLTSRFNLSLPINISKFKVGRGEEIQYLKMSAWAQFLLSRNLWHHLCGLDAPNMEKCCGIWSVFWERFKRLRPQHEIFQRPNFDYSRCCGLILHGDEGRSLRKSAILILATHSIMGYGIRTSSKTSKSDFQRLNYQKSTWVTRFLLGVLPKALYSTDDDDDDDGNDDYEMEPCESEGFDTNTYEALLRVVAEDLRALFEHGIVSPLDGCRYYFCIINVCGDWPFLQKSGSLSRSFYNAAKHATSRTEPKGICHRCLADRPGYVWEDFESREPAWVASMNKESPFITRPSLLILPHIRTDPAELFAWDLFHTWHIGCGKVFLGTSIVLLAMSDLFDGSVDARFRAATQSFLQWCKKERLKPHLRKLNRQNLSWLTSTSYPSGVWSKGHTTRVLNKWFIAECEAKRNEVVQDELLSIAYDCAMFMERFLKGLYGHELWLTAKDAERISSYGLDFLKAYGTGVKAAFQGNKRYFMLQPNLHRLHHIAMDLRHDALRSPNGFVLNPLAFSTQPEEDFIGRPSRVSRRVSPRMVVQRTIQRSLIAAHAAYKKAGLFLGD